MFFTGLDCPYHVPEDTYDIINFDGMKQIADIAFRVVFRFADADDLAFVNYISPREMQRENETAEKSLDFNVSETMGLTFTSSGDFAEKTLTADSNYSLGKTLGQYFSSRSQGENSLRVAKVTQNSDAEKIGLKRGDRIMTLNGRDVSGMVSKFDEKITALLQEEPAGTIYLRITRAGELQEQELRIEIKPDDLADIRRVLQRNFLYRESIAEPDTLIVSTVFADETAESSLKPNDRIMHINGKRASTETLNEAMKLKQPMLLEIERNGKISELNLAL